MNYRQQRNKLQTDKIMWHIVQAASDETEPDEVILDLLEKIRLAVSIALYEMEG
jgi:hypothetical protein